MNDCGLLQCNNNLSVFWEVDAKERLNWVANNIREVCVIRNNSDSTLYCNQFGVSFFKISFFSFPPFFDSFFNFADN